MKVFVDQDTCIGCGLCYGTCDTVFRMNDEGKAEAFQEAAENNNNEVQEAIDGGPVSAISWED